MQKEEVRELRGLQLKLQLRFLGLCAVDLIDYSTISILAGGKVVLLGIFDSLRGAIISFLFGIIIFLLGIIVFLLGIIVSLLGIIIFLLGTITFLPGIIIFLLGIIVLLISGSGQDFELGLDRKYVSRWGFFMGYDNIYKWKRRVVVVDLSWGAMEEHVVVGH
ncbi:hypothetical protein F5H01DRAFT_326187 [Linnemannia elongata]|nr:hypothetical protein F5H01DRAFT_326187 [Linnemannia elongata]